MFHVCVLYILNNTKDYYNLHIQCIVFSFRISILELRV
jgi:hypothetical protein